MTHAMDRESVPEPLNPLGIDGIEFIEFATSKPQALGGVLETMGFRPIARHRSREVELYRQGTMNIIVNAQPADVPRTVQPVETPVAQRLRHPRPRRRRRVPPRARARRVGDSGARAGDGAQHPRDPRRRRKPHLLRRPLRRVLDLRRRLPRDPDRRPAPAGDGRDALLRPRPVHRRRPHRGLGRVLCADLRLHAARGRRPLRHPAQGAAAAEPLPQLLPAADRARRHGPVRAATRSTCSASASARPTSSRPSASSKSAASSSSPRRRCTRASAARSPRRASAA